MCPSIRYGINVPNFGDYHHTRVLADLTASAEEAGWDGFFIWDHLEGEMPFCDPTVALSAIALQTDRIKLGAMITPLPRRRPWKVAREMVSMDHLSGGRVIMGVGLGNPPTEYSKFGEEPGARVRAEKLDESLDIITGLWSGERFSYEGKHYRLEEVTFQASPGAPHPHLGGRLLAQQAAIPTSRAVRWCLSCDELARRTNHSAIENVTGIHWEAQEGPGAFRHRRRKHTRRPRERG